MKTAPGPLQAEVTKAAAGHLAAQDVAALAEHRDPKVRRLVLELRATQAALQGLKSAIEGASLALDAVHAEADPQAQQTTVALLPKVAAKMRALPADTAAKLAQYVGTLGVDVLARAADLLAERQADGD